jgi:hypothetical protein
VVEGNKLSVPRLCPDAFADLKARGTSHSSIMLRRSKTAMHKYVEAIREEDWLVGLKAPISA